MIRECRDFLLANVQDWGIESGGAWSFILHNNYHPHCSNVNLLWFRDSDTYPRIVTKVFHDAELPGREFRNQSFAWSRAPHCVPKPLHFGEHGRFWALWMEGVAGFPFRQGKGSEASVNGMVDAVASLHKVLASPRLDADRYDRSISIPLRTVAEFGSSPAVIAGCEKALADFPADLLGGLPSIPQHGDLFVSNMLGRGRRWYILDWETFGKIDLPFYDVVTLTFSLLRAGGEAPSKWDPALRRWVTGAIHEYAQRLKLNPQRLHSLLPIIFANWFHVQWADGRTEFTRLMYDSIANYFEHRETWESTFVPLMEGA
jgi:hypothetical protein